MPPLQQRYYDLLIERVRTDRYPSSQLLDRLESSIFTADQVTDYVDTLIDKCDESWYPSSQILERIERMLKLVATAA